MNVRVLIADGDQERGQAIAEACARLGLVCRVTSDGAAALETSLGEIPNALICQLKLPLIDGAKLGAILKANPRTQHMSIIYLADHVVDAERKDLDWPVVAPPVDPDRVASAIENQLVGRGHSRQSGPTALGTGDQSSSVEGNLSELPLADLLQLFHVSRKTGTIEVSRSLGRNRRQLGRIVLRGGDVVAASVGPVEKEKAFFRLLSWDRGSFAFKPEVADLETSILTPTRALLREGERQLAEWRRTAIDLPPMSASVTLKIPRSSLPSVIHPLTQEVLVVLDLYSRVQDVVDHCSFPDYQVLRTLHTLIQRDMLDLQQQPEAVMLAREVRLFSAARTARLREWLEIDRPGMPTHRDAKLVIVASNTGVTRDFSRLLRRLPGIELDSESFEKGIKLDDLVSFGRVSVDSDVGIELVHVPASEHFRSVWPMAGHGALATLLLLSAPVSESIKQVRQISQILAEQGSSRIYHLLLLEKGERVSPDDLRHNLSIVDEGSLFLIPIEDAEKAGVLLREMFGRILP